MTMRYRVNAAHVVSDVFEDGEAAVIDLRSGVYFSLNPTGALLWPLLVGGTTLEALIERAHAGTDGDGEVPGAVAAFVASLVDEELVDEVAEPEGEADGADPPAAPAAPGERIRFLPPQLERFDDLQDLLLLDPIHDVSDQGWPHTATG
jgi:hypothetical protein